MGSPGDSKALAELGLVVSKKCKFHYVPDCGGSQAQTPCVSLNLSTTGAVVFSSCSHQAVAAEANYSLWP